MALGLTLGRFVTGSLISAGIAIGGVWFVVDMSLRGMEKAIDTTNLSIQQLERAMAEKIESSIQILRADLKNEFRDTREAIEKASYIEPSFEDETGNIYLVSLKSDAKSIAELYEENSELKSWTSLVGLDLVSNREGTFIFALAGSRLATEKWIANSESGKQYKDILSAGLSSPDVLIDYGCLTRRVKIDGTPIYFPRTENTISGRDGIICLFDDLSEIVPAIEKVKMKN